jgi:surfeit locus 1 family protein
MPSLPFFKKPFILSLLAALSIAFLTYLGFWQLHRAEEKRQMLALAAKQSISAPRVWQAGDAKPKQYERISVTGQYLSDIFLFDNQHHQHQFGYHVLTPLAVDNAHYIIIDRGWVQGDLSRRQFPNVVTPTQIIHLSGVSYYPSTMPWTLGPMVEKKHAKLTIIEQLDIKLLSQLLQKQLSPFVIRLDKTDPFGFTREWAIVSMPPERHMAYALQWFVMALVLFIIVIVLSFKKKL